MIFGVLYLRFLTKDFQNLQHNYHKVFQHIFGADFVVLPDIELNI